MGSEGSGPGSAGQQADPAQLAWDSKIWEAVAAAQFTGTRYANLIDEIIRHALPIMRRAIRTERIFLWCRRRNSQIKLHAPSRWGDDDREELALASVARAVIRFEHTARAGNGWSPTGGATLATYFTNMCIDEFPNQFRSWLATRRRCEPEVLIADPAPPATPEPDEAYLTRETLISHLEHFTPSQRTVTYLQAQGYSHNEIAAMTGLTPRAVEGLARRARQQGRGPGEATP